MRIKEKIIEHKSFEESELLGKNDDDEQLRNRLEDFIENQDSEDKTHTEDKKALEQKKKEEKALKDNLYIETYHKIANAFIAARLESQFDEVIRNTTIKEVVCEFDDETPLEETLKNVTVQIFEDICKLKITNRHFRAIFFFFFQN